MLKVFAITLGLCCAAVFSARAADGDTKPAEKKPLTEEQKALRKELLGKYDKNKDGKIDKEERQAVSAEDKSKLAEAGLAGGGKKKKAE